MGSEKLNMETLHQEIKRHPRAAEIGMIASHRGIVRGTSRDGNPVSGLSVTFDRKAAQEILESVRRMPGIIEVSARFYEGELNVGDDVMAVVIAGDIREHVFPALVEAVERLKKVASHKREHFIGE